METLKNASVKTQFLAAMVAIWAEAFQGRVSVWVATKDTMDALEARRIAKGRGSVEGGPGGGF